MQRGEWPTKRASRHHSMSVIPPQAHNNIANVHPESSTGEDQTAAGQWREHEEGHTTGNIQNTNNIQEHHGLSNEDPPDTT